MLAVPVWPLAAGIASSRRKMGFIGLLGRILKAVCCLITRDSRCACKPDAVAEDAEGKSGSRSPDRPVGRGAEIDKQRRCRRLELVLSTYNSNSSECG